MSTHQPDTSRSRAATGPVPLLPLTAPEAVADARGRRDTRNRRTWGLTAGAAAVAVLGTAGLLGAMAGAAHDTTTTAAVSTTAATTGSTTTATSSSSSLTAASAPNATTTTVGAATTSGGS